MDSLTAKRLMGMSQVGGKHCKKSSKKCNKHHKSRGGDVGYICTKYEPYTFTPQSQNQTPPVLQQPAPVPPVVPAIRPPEQFANPPHQRMQGGKKLASKAYKKRLTNMTVEELRKTARNKKIPIIVKRNGKSEYVKKNTLIKKLCDAH